MTLSRVVLLAAACAALAGCSDSNDPDGTGSGTVAFTFTGGGGGSYNVTGRIPVNESALFTTAWSAGELVDADGAVYVISVRPQTGAFDEVLISIGRLTAGSTTIDVDCTGVVNCSMFSFLLGQSTTSDTDFDFLCTLETGTVTIATASSTRVTGTFGGSGVCENFGGTTQSFTVTGGTFDVPLVSNPVL